MTSAPAARRSSASTSSRRTGTTSTRRWRRSNTSAVFTFEGELLVCERAYFDAATILRQLGIAHDPLTLKGRLATALNHPLTVGGAFLRQALRSVGGGGARS